MTTKNISKWAISEIPFPHFPHLFLLAGLLPAHKSNDIVEVAHMLDATEHRGVGVGWGVMTSLKLHTC